MVKKRRQLEDLFHDGLKDIYFAEKKILTTLPKLAKAAQSEEVKAAFEKHRAETEGHVERLERVFKIIGEAAKGKTCPAINGLAEEGAEIIEEFADTPTLDVGLVAAARAVEHYEMARYLALCEWAEQLGYSDAVPLLQQTLEEEEATDEALAGLSPALGEAAMAEAA